MSEESPNTSRRVLHLIVPGPPSEHMAEKITLAFVDDPVKDFMVLTLTEANAKEALEKIFAANTVAVWTSLR